MKNLRKKHVEILRPCPKNSLDIFEIQKFYGKNLERKMKKGNLVTKKCLKI